MAKATHTGECQLCGRTQKLPNGKLSTHGYTKQWGFFQGVCPGSNHLPYELDAQLLERAELSARDRYNQLSALALQWARESEKVAFEARGEYGKSRHWIFVSPADVRDGRVYYKDVFGREQSEFHGCSPVGAAKQLNERYSRHLGRQAEQNLQYANWLMIRRKAWFPRELQPVAA